MMMMVYTVVVAVMEILRKKTDGKDNDGDGNYGINYDDVNGTNDDGDCYKLQYTYLVAQKICFNERGRS